MKENNSYESRKMQ